MFEDGTHDPAVRDEKHFLVRMFCRQKLQTSGMTTRLDIRFRKPVPTGPDKKIEVRSHIKEMKRSFAILDARIIYNGEICSEAEITYFCFPKDKAESDFYFHGCEVEE